MRLNEFRAVYVGMWLAMAAILVLAFRRVEEPLLGDVAALLILGQTLGRLIEPGPGRKPELPDLADASCWRRSGGAALLVGATHSGEQEPRRYTDPA